MKNIPSYSFCLSSGRFCCSTGISIQRLLVEIRDVDTFKPNVSNNRFCNSDALSSLFLSIHKSMNLRCNSFSFTLAGFTVLLRLVKIPQDLCLLRKLQIVVHENFTESSFSGRSLIASTDKFLSYKSRIFNFKRTVNLPSLHISANLILSGQHSEKK